MRVVDLPMSDLNAIVGEARARCPGYASTAFDELMSALNDSSCQGRDVSTAVLTLIESAWQRGRDAMYNELLEERTRKPTFR